MQLPQRILIPTDFGASAVAALQYAKSLSKISGAALHVLHVMDDPLLGWKMPDHVCPVPALRKFLEEETRDLLSKLLTDEERQAYHAEVRSEWGNPYSKVMEYVKQHNIDLVVMGTHGRGALGHALMGNVAERLVRHAPCPVLVVRAPRQEKSAESMPTAHANSAALPTCILVPTDFSESARAALDYAKELAAVVGAELHLVHVMDDPVLRWNLPDAMAPFPVLRDTVEQEAKAGLARLLKEGNRVTLQTWWGSPSSGILDYAEQHEVDLIVMGTHGRGVIGHALLGSVAERVVRHAKCPTLVVRRSAPAAG